MKRHVNINDVKINEGQKNSCSVCPVHEGISERREVDHIEINSLLLPFIFHIPHTCLATYICHVQIHILPSVMSIYRVKSYTYTHTHMWIYLVPQKYLI